MQTGHRLRHLFATLLLFCHPSRPEALWAEFKHAICDNLPLRLQHLGLFRLSPDEVTDYGL
ncbi:hypothetical protein C8Q70DRAFT_892405, partial [Cubamyces menziesii]